MLTGEEVSPFVEESPKQGSDADVDVADRSMRTDEASAPRVPWCVLVCADLGFELLEPQRVCSAEWESFVADSGLVIRGEVPAGPDRPAFEVELPVDSLQVLSPALLEGRLPHLKPYLSVRNALSATLAGELAPAAAVTQFRRQLADNPVAARAVELLEQLEPARTDRSESAALEAAQAFHAAVAERVGSDVRTCAEQPFFNEPRGALLALRELVMIAGKSGASAVVVCSAARERLVEQFEQVLDACDQAGLSPDIVLWGYPVRVNMDEMKLVSGMLEAAQRHATQLVTSLAHAEPLLEAMADEDAVKPLMMREEMIPFRRLRRNPLSRLLIVSAPRVMVDIGESPPAMCDAAWLVVHHIQRLLVDEGWLLDTVLPAGHDLERSIRFSLSSRIDVPLRLRREAADAGIVVLCGGAAGDHHITLRTAVNPDITNGHFVHVGYNLLYNRVQRICSKRVTCEEGREIPQRRIEHLRGALERLLLPNCQSTDDYDIRITRFGRTLHVRIVFNERIGYPPMEIEEVIKHSPRSAP